MPYASKAQLEKFYTDPHLRKHADKMLTETPGRITDLPQRVRPRPPSKGGASRGKANR